MFSQEKIESIFKNKQDFNKDELDKLYNYFTNFQKKYPVCESIKSLLLDTTTFTSAMTEKKHFMKQRQSMTMNEVQAKYEVINKAFEKAQKKLATLEQKIEKNLLSDAIDYAKKCICTQKEKLEKVNSDDPMLKEWENMKPFAEAFRKDEEPHV